MSDKAVSVPWLARLFPLALALGWLADYLFWDKPGGISFPLFIALALGLGFWLARQTGAAAHRHALWLLAPIAFFALMSVMRVELMTVLLSRTLALFLMALLAASFLGGRWPEYGLGDLIDKLVTFVPKGMGRYRAARDEQEGKQSNWRWAGPILRGLLLAAPILIVLGSLLASADPFFGDWLDDLLSFLDIENLAEYLLRIALILIVANLLVGVYIYALQASEDRKLIGEAKPILSPFLGFGESATILGSVNLLFAAFVIFQFQYLFGGERNINFAGYTYAEYARRGFGEMVFVAFLVLLLFILVSQVAKRESRTERRTFSWLGVALFALVAVILASAYQRLLLYESAYGFSQIRIYSHTFMIWLGLLLAASVVLEIKENQRAFGLAMLGAVLGFAASLSLINVDGFIVHANLERARLGYVLSGDPDSYRYQEVDFDYLVDLSTDAVPALAQEFYRAVADEDLQLQTLSAAALICHAARNDGYADFQQWQSWQASGSRAARIWADLQQNEAFAALDFRVEWHLANWARLYFGALEFECGYAPGLR
jgi:hypothetical protein